MKRNRFNLLSEQMLSEKDISQLKGGDGTLPAFGALETNIINDDIEIKP